MSKAIKTEKEVALYIVENNGFCITSELLCTICPAKDVCCMEFDNPNTGESKCYEWMKNWLKTTKEG